MAAMAAVVASLTRLNVKYNDLGDEGRAIISSAVQGKAGFDLSLYDLDDLSLYDL